MTTAGQVSPAIGPSDGPGPARRIGVALSSGLLLFLLLSYFRFEKVSVLQLDLGFWDILSLLAPELGAVLVLEGVLILLARVPRKDWGAFWWLLCIVTHALAYAGAVLEQAFFLHTESRLNLSLLRYGLNNFEMLEGLILTGVDKDFLRQARLAGAVFLLGFLAGFFLRLRLRRRYYAMAPAGILLLLLPATGNLTRADLAAGTLPELLRSSGGSEKAAERAEKLVVAPHELYRRPRLATSPVALPPAVEPGRPLSFVVVLLESTRFDLLPPYSPQGRQLTPRLAEIADESWVVEEMYATVSHTSKALVGILCGMFPRLEIQVTETFEDGLPLTCLPHLLEQAGYRTAFLQTAVSAFENRPGLVRNLGFQSAAFMETLERPGFERIGYLGIDELAMVEPAGSFLDSVGDEPFFLTLLTLTPHHPYEVAGQDPPPPGSPPFLHYLEALRHQDRFVGELYRSLEERGLLESTAVILLGDHGEAFGEHRRRQHDVVPYEEVVRVPAYLRLPDRFGAPERISGLRQLMDLHPTVLGLARLDWQGKTLGRDLFSTGGAERVVTSCWYTDYCLGMREGSRKFVYHFGIRPTEVFDLSRDPAERTDLSEELEAEVIRAAEQRMLGLKLSIDGFWAQQPAAGEEPLWWNERPAPQP